MAEERKTGQKSYSPHSLALEALREVRDASQENRVALVTQHLQQMGVIDPRAWAEGSMQVMDDRIMRRLFDMTTSPPKVRNWAVAVGSMISYKWGREAVMDDAKALAVLLMRYAITLAVVDEAGLLVKV